MIVHFDRFDYFQSLVAYNLDYPLIQDKIAAITSLKLQVTCENHKYLRSLNPLLDGNSNVERYVLIQT